MKKLLISSFIFTVIAFMTAIAVFADISADAPTINSALINDNKNEVILNISLPNKLLNSDLYIFKVLDDDTDVNYMTPTLQITSPETRFDVTLPFDAIDNFSPFYGYCIATQNENGNYLKNSKTKFLDNFSVLAENTSPYPKKNSIKGLQIKHIDDAFSLGVKHTVVNAYVNELISSSSDNSYSYLFGGDIFYFKKSTLNSLDYRIKTLSESNINIYMNILLAFDTTAPDTLYYQDAGGKDNALYAINISNDFAKKQIAALISFLSERYTDTSFDKGFCGSYIIGYEVNDQANRNSAGISDLAGYVKEYSTLLRICDTAVRSNYENGRVFVSLSNLWKSGSKESSYTFGAKEFIDVLLENSYDIPFGISLNPYPSDLSISDYNDDPLATDSMDTDFLTLKNINIMLSYLNSEKAMLGDNKRPFIVGEFGLSGKFGDVGEMAQANSYAHAFLVLSSSKDIEAFIWHGHQDDPQENDLFYGLLTEKNTERGEKKIIYDVFKYIDTNTSAEMLKSTFSSDFGISEQSFNKKLLSITDLKKHPSFKGLSSSVIFDFSRSIYGFYPADNAEYLERRKDQGITFMRIKLLENSEGFFGGAGMMNDAPILSSDSEYIRLKVRVISEKKNAEIKLVIASQDADSDKETYLELCSDISTNEWVELVYDIKDIDVSKSSFSVIKFWTERSENSHDEIYLDIANAEVYKHSQTASLRILFYIFISLSLLSGAILIMSFDNNLRRFIKIKRQSAKK